MQANLDAFFFDSQIAEVVGQLSNLSSNFCELHLAFSDLSQGSALVVLRNRKATSWITMQRNGVKTTGSNAKEL